MSDVWTDLEAALGAAFQGEEPDLGYLGYDPGSGFQLAYNNSPVWVWVRIERGSAISVTKAINAGAPLLPGYPVEVTYRMTEDGNRTPIVRGHPILGPRYLKEAAPPSLVAPHTHEPGWGLEDPVSRRRIRGGRVRAGSGLVLVIDECWYTYNGETKYLAATTYDATPHLPTGGGMQCWLHVGINPATNTLVGVRGTSELPTGFELTKSMLASIPMSGYLPLCGVKLAQGLTAFTSEQQFEDTRPFVGTAAPSLRHVFTPDAANVPGPAVFDVYVCGTNTWRIPIIRFDASANESAYWAWVLPAVLSPTVAATLRLHWTAAAGSGDVAWRLHHLSRGNDEFLDAVGTSVTVTDTLLNLGDNHIVSTTLTTTGWTAGKLLLLRLERLATDPADTLSDDAYFIGMDLELHG